MNLLEYLMTIMKREVEQQRQSVKGMRKSQNKMVGTLVPRTTE
jgi:hypothetical protein